jgi:hypothetical protein
LEDATDSYANTAFGFRAGANVTDGESNVFFGPITGNAITHGDRNTIIGDTSGPWTNDISRGVFIGYNAGWYETNDDRLHIGVDKNNTLIYGEFDNKKLEIRGDLTIGEGAAGVDYTLTFDGESNDGVVTWMEDEDYFKFSDDVNLDTLTASSAVYTDASKTLTSTAPTSGTIGYWDRTGTLLSPDTAGDEVQADGGLIINKTSGLGIKVDTTTPTFGWRDILGAIRTRGVGATDPNDTTYRNGLKGYTFAVNDEAWIEYHIPHDYVAGTDIHLHFHWSHNSAIVTGGTATWGYEITYAKGHNQAAFPASVTGTFSPNASTTQYQHMVSEIQISASSPSGSQIDSDDIEPDGIILCRVYLSANGITSSGAVPDPFLHEVDVHYQSTNIGTKNNSPNFYS